MIKDLNKIKMRQKFASLPKLLKDIERDGADVHDKAIVRMLGLNPYDVDFIAVSGWLEIFQEKKIELDLRINHPLVEGHEFRVTIRHPDHTSETSITRTHSFNDGFAIAYIKLCIKLGWLI